MLPLEDKGHGEKLQHQTSWGNPPNYLPRLTNTLRCFYFPARNVLFKLLFIENKDGVIHTTYSQRDIAHRHYADNKMKVDVVNQEEDEHGTINDA